MKITLIYPRFKYRNVGNTEEPLGILSIAAVLKKADYSVSFYDLTFAKNLEILKEDILNSDLVGFSATSPLFGIAREILTFVKEINPNVKTVAGGPHPTQDPKNAVEAGFDFAVIGEGEETIIQLVKGLSEGDCSEVNGIAYKENGDIKINNIQSFISDLDTVPLIDRKLIDYSKYHTFGMMATRGCPFSCFYCKPMQEKLFGNRLRKRSVLNIVDEIEQLHKIDKNKVIYFKDDTLTICSADWFKEFGTELRKRKLRVKWGCNSRVDTVNREKLKLMKDAGCVGLSFGVESGSQKIIDFYNKGTKIEQVIDVFALCRKLKLQTMAFIMLGAPVETRQDLEETYQLVRKIKPNSWITYVTTPFPGNSLHEYAKNRGIIQIDNYIEYDNAQNSKDLNLPMQLDRLNKKDIQEYRDKINHYMIRRTILLRLLGILIKPSEFKKMILEAPKAFNLLKILLRRY